MDNSEIIKNLRNFCSSKGISTNGVLVITIQNNWTTSFSSLIVDFNSNELLPNYPAELLTNYNEKRLGDLLICYKSDLPRPVYSDTPVVSTPENLPFCCPDKLIPYKPIRTEKDIAFSDFLKSLGAYPNYIFEVKKQVNNGQLLSTKYYSLNGGVIKEVFDDMFENIKFYIRKLLNGLCSIIKRILTCVESYIFLICISSLVSTSVCAFIVSSCRSISFFSVIVDQCEPNFLYSQNYISFLLVD
ncbi:hypothetical protein PPL_04900 [Heterostelium album PN500]|uniref:Uncharacterized protein n=1 Tax=Heterostelium pallidum (strain ATCC 26659 / Pp 5 / PN500) TaxID=670386 RepID=D3B8V7_HETP5|nr:hypothetical protein PPL_04900 [Heterostelium album PN500]EFA82475.1 hypothetical protein PPL_04900 [Heterostelium album PN500]|eukprot:XP_020434592.1 hypothetical protein PPL_04900 [Heterostelium album PN500]